MPVVLRCNHCDAERRLTDQQMLERLQMRGMLRRDAKPSADLIRELLSNVVSDAPCADCGGLGASVHDDWSDDWSDEVLCKGCKAIILAERLEVFPDTTYCPACQSSAEAGGSPGEEAEYCQRCGGIMKMKGRGGAGLAGYQMVCGDCGKRAS